MNRLLLAAFAALVLAPAADAHFVFVVPAANGAAATVVLSEDLNPDEAVPAAKMAGLKLTVRDAAGKDTAVEYKTEAHSLKADLPGAGPRVVFGSVAYGIMQRGESKPYLLSYHPKAVIGRVAADRLVVGEKLPVELVPETTEGVNRLRFYAAGKPVEGAEVTLIKPDGSSAKLKTGKDGRTDRIEGTGRFAAWAKTVNPTAGELNGKKYDESRDYATLVYDAEPPAADGAVNSPYPPLPVGVSSLGAIACDGYLYVYGGHAGQTHSYDTKSVLGTFHRLKLDGGTKWEELPGGPIAQGMNLAAFGGKVYRVGGMQPRNVPGEPADNYSLADAARFDPKAGKWDELPPLPAGRSSHDLVAVGNKLVVVGGWEAKGKGTPSAWHDTALVMDLSAERPEWKAIPQPFKKRALTAAVVGNKVYVLGGLTADSTDKTTHILDAATGTWTTGPDLPGTDRAAFSPAAATVNGRVVVNTSLGSVYRLTADGSAWEQVGTSVGNRMVARLIPLGDDTVALVGGASRRGNAAAVEVIKLTAAGEKVSAADAK